MGGTLGNIMKGQQPLQTVGSVSSVPLYGAPAGPSTGTKVAQGLIQGGLQGLSQFGAGPQSPYAPSPSMPAPGPAPTQVDPSFFAPTNFGGFSPQERQMVGGSSGRSAFYGGQ